MPVVSTVVDALSQAGFIGLTGEKEAHFVPILPPETTPLKRVLDAVRSNEGTGHPDIGPTISPPAIETMVTQLDDAVGDRLGGLTVKDFALTPEAEPAIRQVAP